MSGPLGPRPGISSGILPGSSSGRGGSPGSRIGGGASGFGLPGGIPGGGSVGVPGVAGGISGGSIGIYIVTLRFSPRSGSSALPTAYQREMAAIVHGFAARHAIEGTPAHAGAKVLRRRVSWRLRGIKCAAAIHTRGGRDRFEGNGGTPTASREGWVRSRPGCPRRRR